MGWSPLWDRIIMSSVWSESKDVKILWITLLALKNRNGEVYGSIVGLAKQAVLTVEEASAALEVLTSPDPYTVTAEFQGRRVEVIPGGWKILNHDKYRRMIQEEYKKEYNAAKQRDYRARKKTEKEQAQDAAQFAGSTKHLPSQKFAENSSEPLTTHNVHQFMNHDPGPESEPIEKTTEQFIDENL